MTKGSPAVMRDGESAGQYRERMIVAAARAAFLEEGYDGTSMDLVARASGFTKKTLYNYFPSKEDLFFAVFGELCDDIIKEIHNLDECSADSPENALKGFCLQTLDVVSTPHKVEAFRLAIDVAKRFPQLGDQLRRVTMERIDAELQALLISLVKAGQLRIDHTELAARYLIGMITSVMLNRLLGSPEHADLEERQLFVNGAVDLFCRGYRP